MMLSSDRGPLNRSKLPAPMRLALIGSGGGAREFSSYERMLAGVDCVVGGRTPAKPPWSEVIVFWGGFLRQSTP